MRRCLELLRPLFYNKNRVRAQKRFPESVKKGGKNFLMNTIIISEETKTRVQEFTLPSYREIPNIGLFLEQATKFVSEYLEPLEGIVITGSMISNYVKKKLIENPVKKQYFREQIADIVFIALVKSVLSLEEAEKLLRLQRERYDKQTAYEYFCKEFKRVLMFVFGVETELEEVSDSDSVEKELLRKVLTAAAYQIYINEVFKTVE